MNRLIHRTFLVLAALAALCAGAWSAHASNPDALWQIVSEQCVPESHDPSLHNTCAFVDPVQGYAVLKDIHGIGQHLLIPTDRITGIESPRLTQPGLPNYWRDAWEARSYVERAIHTPLSREDVGLAINSTSGRTQNQLHIHIDCMDPAVVAALGAQKGSISEQWQALAVPLDGHRYRARLITDATLAHTDPFELLLADVQSRGVSMADQTLLLTGTTLANGQPAFILLNDQVNGLDRASAEELLDHACQLRGQNAPAAASAAN
jgi:CDP-diacylglycerol pyrophosphatase